MILASHVQQFNIVFSTKDEYGADCPQALQHKKQENQKKLAT